MASVLEESVAPTVINLTVDATQDVSDQRASALVAYQGAALWTDEDVASVDVCNVVSSQMNAVVAKKKALIEKRMSLTRPIDAAKKAAMDLFQPYVDQLEQAEQHLKALILRFHKREDERREIEERRLREIQRQEQERLAKEAAERRAEAEKEAAEKRRQAEVAAKAGHLEGQQMALAAAVEIEQQGQREAEGLMQAAAVAPAAIVTPTKVAGSGRTERWYGEVNKPELIDFISKHHEYLYLVDVDQSKCNNVANTQRENCKVGGIKAVKDHTISARGKR
jgi:hypothetical protein